MSEEELLDTKNKILKTASKLFASNGFEGTSVRDIAKEADVNLASVNYHFQSKENLYGAVFDHNYAWLSEQVERISVDTSLDTKEFAWRIYEFFVGNSTELMNCFKVMLTDTIVAPEGIQSLVETKCFGPPGGAAMLKVITRDLGEECPLGAREWVMRMTFSILVHFGVIMGTSFMKAKCSSIPFMHPENKKRDIYTLVDALLNQAKKEPNTRWLDLGKN
jgi:AcrR family transcriptional regulator